MSNIKDNGKSNLHDIDKNPEVAAEHAKGSGGPLSLLFPPDLTVWSEARKLIADKNVRVDDVAACSGQDPSIVIELLKTSNAMYFSAGRQPITTTRTAIIRLGQDVVMDLLDKMRDRPQITVKESHQWFSAHRSRCKRTSIVARILAETAAKTLADECQTVGLFLYVGEMLAVLHLAERYLELTSELSRSGLNYRLAQDLKFDVEKMGLNYLRRQGIPEALLFAIDREGRSKSADKAIMKPLCLAAGELVEAFDANRWDKFAPGKTIPPKSAIRTLPFTEGQYLKLYERASEYLFGMKVTEERQKQQQAQARTSAAISAAEAQTDSEQDVLQSEIEHILGDTQEVASAKLKELAKAAAAEQPKKEQARDTSKSSQTVSSERQQEFSLQSSKPKTKARQNKSKVIAPPKMASKNAETIITTFTDVLNNAANSEELLAQILAMLVDNGPFQKSALVVVSKDRTKALVVAARGPNIGNGQQIDISDPLNPLAQCFSKVQSFGNKESKCSPFGSRSFALAPIDADHDTPVALYADCGNEGAITFDARRVFRTVIDILNEKLPNIPGGIPVELN
jgi:HD-like signal output (HDOD) protein